MICAKKTLFFSSLIQKKRSSEPIYAEPSKPSAAVLGKAIPAVRASCSSADAIVKGADEHDGVQLRRGPNESDAVVAHEQVAYENTGILNIEKTTKARHSDSHIINEYSNLSHTETNAQRPPVETSTRKYHSKSFSLSENRVAANLNLFQQNRDLWEKRTEMQSTHSLPAPRILTRNRIAPDLVMDLPISNKERTVNSSRESLNSSDEANSDGASTSGSAAGATVVAKTATGDVVNSKSIEDMTSAERFASQSQCTLKKNERFSAGTATNHENIDTHKANHQIDGKAGGSSNIATVLATRSAAFEKPKAEIKPQENALLKELTKANSETSNDTSIASTKELANIKPTIAAKDLQHKSPIPSRNTQKFVSQFADLKLTGGCLTSGSNTTAINTVTDSQPQQQQKEQSASLTSFKPQVKVKPQILRKPLVLPPTTPETVRRNQE